MGRSCQFFFPNTALYITGNPLYRISKVSEAAEVEGYREIGGRKSCFMNKTQKTALGMLAIVTKVLLNTVKLFSKPKN